MTDDDTHDRRDSQESDLPKELSNLARRALAQAGFSRLDQIAGLSEDEIKQLHGVGPKAIDQLRRSLSAKGLSFAAEPGSKDNGAQP